MCITVRLAYRDLMPTSLSRQSLLIDTNYNRVRVKPTTSLPQRFYHFTFLQKERDTFLKKCFVVVVRGFVYVCVCVSVYHECMHVH